MTYTPSRTSCGYTLQPVTENHLLALFAAASPFLDGAAKVRLPDIMTAAKILSFQGDVESVLHGMTNLRWTWRDRWILLSKVWSRQFFLHNAGEIFRHLDSILKGRKFQVIERA